MSTGSTDKILRIVFFTPTRRGGWGVPTLFWGGPGVGKSSLIEGAAERYGLPCEVLSPGERGEGAFGVTPVPGESGYLEYPPPSWCEPYTEDKRGVVFVDELNQAPPALQPPLQGLLLARRIGGAYLSRRTRMVGASNRVEDAAAGWNLPAPIANRLCHLDWETPTVDQWSDWLMGGADGAPPEVESASALEERVMAAWSAPWATARALIATFLRARPNLHYACPKAGHPDAGGPWPSPRTWEMAARLIASAQVHGASVEVSDRLVQGCVGHGATAELVDYRVNLDLPDPEAVLDGRVEFKIDKRRIDRTYAVATATTEIVVSAAADEAVRASKAWKGRADRLFSLLAEISESSADLVYNAAKRIATAKLHMYNADSRTLVKRMLTPMTATAGSR